MTIIVNDIWSDPRTAKAIELAYDRYSFKYIMKQTGLTTGQLSYRLTKHGVSLKEQRDGVQVVQVRRSTQRTVRTVPAPRERSWHVDGIRLRRVAKR